MQSALLALASAFTTAVYFVYLSRVMKRHAGISSTRALAASHLVAAAALVPFWLWFSAPPPEALLSFSVWGLLLAAALLLVISRQLYFYAYAHTDVANITVFSALTPVYALATGFFLLGEFPSLLSLAGLLLICASIYGMFLKKGDGLLGPFRQIARSRPILCAFLSTIPTALAATFQKQLLFTLDAVTFSLLLLLSIGLLAAAVSAGKGSSTRLPRGFLIASAVLLPAIHVLFCLLMLDQQTATSLVLQRCSIVFQILLAYVFLRETAHASRRLVAGILITLGFALVIAGSPPTDKEWFAARMDNSPPLFLLPDNDEPLLNRIADDTQRVAAELLIQRLAMRPQPEALRPISCAVVGNSSNLKDSGYGTLIDGHTYVFRMNNAPMQGYEKDVGSRITHHTTHNAIRALKDYGTDVTHLLFIENLNVNDNAYTLEQYWNSAARKVVAMAQQFMPDTLKDHGSFSGENIPDHLPALTGRLILVHPSFVQYINERWFKPKKMPNRSQWPSTGYRTLMLALHMCDSVDVFGFGRPDEKTEKWEHYFPTPGDNTYGHRPAFQEETLEELEKRGLIRIYRGTEPTGTKKPKY